MFNKVDEGFLTNVVESVLNTSDMTQAVSNSNTYNVHAAGVNGLELGKIPLVDSSILIRLLIRNRAEHFKDQLLVVVRDFVEGTVQASILRDRVRCLPTTSSKLVEIVTRVDRSVEC